MRLTADLILESPSFLNPLQERELDLRGRKIAAIENLGATRDQYDTIDFTDNEIKKLENFPELQRLKMLLLANNKITSIALSFPENLPNLNHINLANNRIKHLAELKPLTQCKDITMLSCAENPIAKHEYYRPYLIYKLRKLKLLDFKRVTADEKRDARKLFSGDKGKEFEREILAGSAREMSKNASAQTSAQAKAIEKAIREAKTLSEVQNLKRDLAAGKLPS